MNIQKYKAKIADSQKEVVGYITEVRQYLGNGSYGRCKDYLISVTEISMPNGDYGTYKVEAKSISLYNDCPVCEINEQNKKFNYMACSEKCYNKL